MKNSVSSKRRLSCCGMRICAVGDEYFVSLEENVHRGMQISVHEALCHRRQLFTVESELCRMRPVYGCL